MTLTVRERFLRYMSFEPVGRIPLMEVGVWDEALERWRHEGIPKWVTDLRHLEDYLQLDRSWNCNWLAINDGIWPPFESETVEETDSTIVYRGGDGVLLRQHKHSMSIPQFLRFPVETEADYDRLMPRLSAGDPGRYAADFEDDLRWRRARGEIIGVSFSGFFGFPRSLMGAENWCLAFHDQPDLVRRIIRDRATFGKQLYARLADAGSVDFVQIWEDMAYNAWPLISPRHVRSFMLDPLMEMVEFFRENGVPLIMVDSDGHVDDLLPIFLEAGIDGIHPCERAAGTDPLELRRRSPGCRLSGGMDKRAIAAGPSGIDAELRRLRPLIEEGAFIPSLDHFVPPDISWDNFVYYVEKRRGLQGGPSAS